MSTFNFVFSDLTGATHLRFSIPDSTLNWLSTLSGDAKQQAITGFTREEELLHKQDHRRLFFMLLRILMPEDAQSVIDAAERFDRLKWNHVDKYEFEDAARCKRQHDLAFASLANFVNGDSTVLPDHLQQLFKLLAAESVA
ncbi:hypothetical protein N9N28_17280 [Rubripirellula amarantea]|nr:hypothetical protein [Rubripirellula amarantea]